MKNKRHYVLGRLLFASLVGIARPRVLLLNMFLRLLKKFIVALGKKRRRPIDETVS
jgi:hypothetical protein